MTLENESLAYIQNKDMLSAFTFQVLLEDEPSVERYFFFKLKLINIDDFIKEANTMVKKRQEKLDLLMS